MLKKILAALAVVVLCVGPAAVLVGVGVLMNPAANASCGSGSSLTVGPIPDELEVTTRDGETFTLNKKQLTHAATIITVGGQTDGVDARGATIALMAALTESTLRQLANTGTYPESGNYPNDGNGSDHDSLGLFQMRPQAGWGTVAELMDTTYQARAFYGGPSGPNYPSPRGMLDVPGWETMDMGEVAQAVEVSAFPERYQNYQPVAEAILDALTVSAPSGTRGGTGSVPETTRIMFPLPEGTWTKTSDWGYRSDPFTGETTYHAGTDYAAADGTPIYAAADGRVVWAEFNGGYGGLIIIEHTVQGEAVRSVYAHMWERGIHVQEGQTVTAGTHIGDVGSSGRSTGANLHFEIRPGSTGTESIDADQWLANHGATEPDGNSAPGPGCAPGGAGADAAEFTGDGGKLVDDPTGTGGQVTARTAHMVVQTRNAFPGTGWACYSPRPRKRSDHPLGRACDVTVGNQIGHYPSAEQVDYGWRLTDWLETNAETLGISYLIWQGQIWSTARADEGWQPYGDGGMHDPGNVTGGHFDRIHISVKEG
ncbi:M23 family metallopeptidase [Microbacterium sp.]|uniref:M23 family metallopeptidase n=1 Tax=Microbacterium sp. TaxID=51671 RepID=UPI0028B05756|nr:M23 family metallopeptidase [Microbacterium sp.]